MCEIVFCIWVANYFLASCHRVGTRLLFFKQENTCFFKPVPSNKFVNNSRKARPKMHQCSNMYRQSVFVKVQTNTNAFFCSNIEYEYENAYFRFSFPTVLYIFLFFFKFEMAAGRPGRYSRIGSGQIRLLGCPLPGCFLELTVLLAIIMVGQQVHVFI